MEPPSCDPLPLLILLSDLLDPGFLIPLIAILVLLVFSALFSGSEVAFFSLSPVQLEQIRDEEDDNSKRLIALLEHPDREQASKLLLATILIANNFVNVAIILLSAFLTPYLFPQSEDPTLILGITLSPFLVSFLLQVVSVTFFLVLFGEVIPKVYATNNNRSMALLMSLPLTMVQRILLPVSKPLVLSSGFLERKLALKGSQISVSDLGHALELTNDRDRSEEEQKILEGIVSFGSKDVKQIMTSRVDITAFPDDLPFRGLLDQIVKAGYSRVPIYRNTIDEVAGILYIKDLLPHMEDEEADWKSLLRSPFIVPENKKIDDLLKEFQGRKTHMAIVVDEYGGTLGLVTLEDVIEEIVGDITDEFDDEDVHFTRIDELNYVFEGKTALIDLYRILDLDGAPFEAAKGDSDTLAGFVIEQTGKIPLKGERFNFENLSFTIEAADKRKIRQVKVTIKPENENE